MSKECELSEEPNPNNVKNEEYEKLVKNQRDQFFLQEAVIKNNVKAVKYMLKQNVDINCRDSWGRSPIHWAASSGNVDIIKLLVNCNCDLEAKDNIGMRPIASAAWFGKKEAVELLINFGVNPTVLNKKQLTLLMCASKKGHLEVVDYLLNSLDDVTLNEVDVDGQTALFHASVEGHADVVSRLIEAGADVNIKNKVFVSPLEAACTKGANVRAAKVLLENGALVENSQWRKGNTLIHLAAFNGKSDVLKTLIDYGIPVDQKNEKGYTALHMASMQKNPKVTAVLIEEGANKNQPDRDENTPLHLACFYQKPEIVKELISHHVESDWLNAQFKTPLHVAAKSGHTELCKMLLDAGANTQLIDEDGNKALKIAAKAGYTSIVDLIVKTDLNDVLMKRAPKENNDKNIDSNWINSKTIRGFLYNLAYVQLKPEDWKKLAKLWNFNDAHIEAIEYQYHGLTSYKEHGFRALLIWLQVLPQDLHPIKELHECLIAIGKRQIAETFLRSVNKEMANWKKMEAMKEQTTKCF